MRTYSLLSFILLALLMVGCGPAPAPDLVLQERPVFLGRAVFLSTPVAAPSGSLETLQVSLQQFDGSVITAASEPITVTLTNPGSATLSGTTIRNAANGVATFDNLGVLPSGVYTLTATSPGYQSGQSAQFLVPAQPAAVLNFLVQPSNGNPGGLITPAIQVEARDSQGALTDTRITLALGNNPGGATLGGSLTQGTTNGVAVFNNITVSTAGTGYTLTADTNTTSPVASTAFDITGGSASLVSFLVQPSNALTGGAIVPAIRVETRDGGGSLVNTSVTLALGANPGGATLGGTLARNTVDGVATFGDITVSAPGTGYTLSADTTSTTPVASNPFNVSDAVVRILLSSGVLTPFVAVFDLNVDGDVAPLRTISGPATGMLTGTGSLFLRGAELFAVNANSITVHNSGASGNAPPLRTIEGPATGLSGGEIAVVDNDLIVSQLSRIVVFPADATGDVAPIRTIAGPKTTLNFAFLGGLESNGTEIFATVGGITGVQDPAIAVFPIGADGDVAPTRLISGPKTELAGPTDLTLSATEIFVVDFNAIRVYPITATGDQAPLRVITGPNTGLLAALDIALFNGNLYVTNPGDNSMKVFSATGNGNIAPLRTLIGPKTGFVGSTPSGIVIGPVP